MASRLARWTLQGGLLALALIVAAVLGEGVARLVLDPADFLMVRDPILGQRLDPGGSGHDQWGFRNPEVPESVEVVTIGDSQTYGVGLPRGSSWPAQLSRLTGRSLYNASLPSYSPVQYHELLRRYALRLKPGAVIVGVYLGNDLLESYRMVYGHPHYLALRRPDMPAPRTLARVVDPGSKPRGLSSQVRRWLSGHSVLYQATVAVLQGRVQRDLSADVVREGLRLALLQLGQMGRLCDSAGVALTVALIPTKERVYQPLIEADPTVGRNAELRRMLANEEEADREVRRFLEENKVGYVDLLPPLRAVVGRAVIYPPDDDGHPTAAGYAVIARAVEHAIGSRPAARGASRSGGRPAPGT